MPHGMLEHSSPHSGARGIALGIAAAAATLLCSAAHASVDMAMAKAVNGKRLTVGFESCGINAGHSPLPPTFAAAAPVTEAPSALQRMQQSQEQPSPSASIGGAAAAPTAMRAIAAGAKSLVRPTGRLAMSVSAPAFAGCVPNAAAPVAPVPDDDIELGTLAIPVDSTRFDDRWERVRRAPAARLMRTQLDRAAVTHGLGEATMIERVNRWVNHKIAYIEDDRNYRQRDFWATADETVGRGSGDCEDFAILKMHMLRAAGIDDDRMKLVLLRDLAINADHAFLLVRSNAGWVVLDNMTDRIYDGRRADAVRPILSFSGNRRWIHGYSDGPAPAIMAASTVKASSAVFASAAPPRMERQSFKTAAAARAGRKLAAVQMSIVNELPRMFGRFPRSGGGK